MAGKAATDTIVALSSGKLPAAIAIVRSSGADAIAALVGLAGSVPAERQAALRTLRDPQDGTEIDRALILVFHGPNSSTGEDVVEYHCHGSPAIAAKLLDVLCSRDGTRIAEPGEFTRRALFNGRIDLTEAEGLADLLEAETEVQRRAALKNAEGGLRRIVEGWRDRLILLSARAEAAIDYVDDEDETHADAAALSNEAAMLTEEVEALLKSPRAEPLKDGIRVVLAGPPNVGKSSLFNALLNTQRAIVTSIAGTTRDSIEAPVAIRGIPFVLVDTAGIHESEEVVEQIGIARARSEILRADVLLWLGPLNETPASVDKLIPIQPKSDLCKHAGDSGSLAVSSVTGEGVVELLQVLAELGQAFVPRDDQVAVNRRQSDALNAMVDSLSLREANDIVLTAQALRMASEALDRLSGRAGIEDMLDALFGRFCLGK
jgi:tRNA modification GTPase